MEQVAFLKFKIKCKTKDIHWVGKLNEKVFFRVKIHVALPVIISVFNSNNPRFNQMTLYDGEAECIFPVTKQQLEFVDNFLDGKFRSYEQKIQLPYSVDGKEYVSLEGAFDPNTTKPLELIPEDIAKIGDFVKRALEETFVSFVKACRWRYGATSPADPVDFFGFYWSGTSTNMDYYPATKKTFELDGISPIRVTEPNLVEIQELFGKNKAREPLSHQLLYQAKELYNSKHYESAVVTGYLAFEAGVKSYIGNKSSEVDWLLSNMQSPNVPLLFKKLLPLSAAVDSIAWEKLKHLHSELQKLMECRNKIVHTGTISEKFPVPLKFLDTVRETLYLLDAINGQDWAKMHLSKKTLDALGWESNRILENDGPGGVRLIIENWQ